MTGGEIAGLIAAGAFAVIAIFVAWALIKLGGVFDQTRGVIKDIGTETVPLLKEVTATVSTTQQQLVKVDSITTNVAQVSTNVSALTALFAATLGSPVVKVAAFSYGVRQAVTGRRPSAGGRRRKA